jgi:hypothetical protein
MVRVPVQDQIRAVTIHDFRKTRTTQVRMNSGASPTIVAAIGA